MKKIILATVATVVFTHAASALEVGKMYVRGDLGYQFSSLGFRRGNDRLKGFTGDIGFGYALSDSVRTDITLNFARPTKLADDGLSPAIQYNTMITELKLKDVKLAKNGTAVNSKTKIKQKSMGLMFNAYYDFNNASDFIPYVMAGVGINRSSIELNTTVDLTMVDTAGKDVNATQDLTTVKSKNKTSFAYQVGVGTTYKMSKDIYLDIGYKLSGITGKYDSKDTKISEDVDYKGVDNWVNPKLSHTLTTGIRFAF